MRIEPIIIAITCFILFGFIRHSDSILMKVTASSLLHSGSRATVRAISNQPEVDEIEPGIDEIKPNGSSWACCKTHQINRTLKK